MTAVRLATTAVQLGLAIPVLYCLWALGGLMLNDYRRYGTPFPTVDHNLPADDPADVRIDTHA